MNHFHLFEVFGVEIEYMVVDAETLEIRPVVDKLLTQLNQGQLTSDVELGSITWSNELASHVVELKSTMPSSDLSALASDFREAQTKLQPVLQSLGLRLLPTAMHPWMDPARETQLWPHDNFEIYSCYHRIFDCHRHGWANVQSTHLNLPFDGDQEFAKLHAAVRLVLPLLPALAASSPIIDGRLGPISDTRLHHYVHHCDQVPSLIGEVIPEPLYSAAEYQAAIFPPIAKQIGLLDSAGVMNVNFLNSRGAIARFDRGSIEVRLLDSQETPEMDVAICETVAAVLRLLIDDRWSSFEQRASMSSTALRTILDATIQSAEEAKIEDGKFLGQFGLSDKPTSALDVWRKLVREAIQADLLTGAACEWINVILESGTLSSRIRNAIGQTVNRIESGQSIPHEALQATYQELATCLAEGRPFLLS